MKNKIREWCGHDYIKVNKKQYENFMRYFGDKVSSNCFMGWCDSYDWSLRSGKYKVGTFENADECNVARNYFETYGKREEYYLRVEYIEKHNYDINTVVPKPREKRLTKKEKEFAKTFGDFFDALFKRMCEEENKKQRRKEE